MWDRAAACFHADKKLPDSCGRGSSGCDRMVLNFKPARALPAWADVAPNERAGADHRFQTATVGRRFAQTRFESEAAGGMVPCLEVACSSGRVVGDLRRR